MPHDSAALLIDSEQNEYEYTIKDFDFILGFRNRNEDCTQLHPSLSYQPDKVALVFILINIDKLLSWGKSVKSSKKNKQLRTETCVVV